MLALLLLAPLGGCATPPASKPIVLRPPKPHFAQRPPPRTPLPLPPAPPVEAEPQRASAEAQTTGLSPAEKQKLLQGFDEYLSRAGHK